MPLWRRANIAELYSFWYKMKKNLFFFFCFFAFFLVLVSSKKKKKTEKRRVACFWNATRFWIGRDGDKRELKKDVSRARLGLSQLRSRSGNIPRENDAPERNTGSEKWGRRSLRREHLLIFFVSFLQSIIQLSYSYRFNPMDYILLILLSLYALL